MKGFFFFLLGYLVIVRACPKGIQGLRGNEQDLDTLRPGSYVQSAWELRCPHDILTSYIKLKALFPQYLTSDAIGTSQLDVLASRATFRLNLPKDNYFSLQSVIKTAFPTCSLLETHRTESKPKGYGVANTDVTVEVKKTFSWRCLSGFLVKSYITFVEILVGLRINRWYVRT